MDFIEIEYRETTTDYAMTDLQSHDYYELYFLLEGTRDVFFEDKMFILPKNSICIFPPFSMHKTEGGPYKRVNIYISRDLLNANEEAFLNGCTDSVAFQIDSEVSGLFFGLLKQASQIQDTTPFKKSYVLAFTKSLLYLLQRYRLTPLTHSATSNHPKNNDPFILKIVSYINEHFAENLTLDHLSQLFFTSKNTLCKRFQAVMNCSIMDYCSHVRLNEAKHLLLTTKKSLDEIAERCGYASANYFSLIFKRKIGLSPLNYRKKK